MFECIFEATRVVVACVVSVHSVLGDADWKGIAFESWGSRQFYDESPAHSLSGFARIWVIPYLQNIKQVQVSSIVIGQRGRRSRRRVLKHDLTEIALPWRWVVRHEKVSRNIRCLECFRWVYLCKQDHIHLY